MPKPENSFEQFLRDFNLTNAQSSESIQMPTAPRHPSFLELVQLERQHSEKPPQARPPQRLFGGLLHGDLELLRTDMGRQPDKYEVEERELVEALAAGGRNPSELRPDELAVLDAATVNFTAPARRIRAKGRTPRRSEDTASGASPIPGQDVPQESPRPYWWLD